jgi:hypothetical protein
MQDHIDQMLQELAHYAAGGDVHPHVEQMARELADKARTEGHQQLLTRMARGVPDDVTDSAFGASGYAYHTPHRPIENSQEKAIGERVTPIHERAFTTERPLAAHKLNQIEAVPVSSDAVRHFAKEMHDAGVTGMMHKDAKRFSAVMPSSKNEGHHQATYFDNQGAISDTQHADPVDAIHHLLDSGYTKILPEHRLGSLIQKTMMGMKLAHGGSVEPSHDDMLAHIMLHKADGGSIRHEPTEIGVDEAPGMIVKRYMPAGVSDGRGNIPVGGVDLNQGQPGQQFAPEQPPQGMPPQGEPGQPPAGMPPTGPQAPAGPPSNILNMTRQGQAMSAMKAPAPMAPAQMAKPVAPPNPSPLIKNGMARMAEGGIVNEKHEKNRMEFLRGSQVPERVYHGTGNLENMESFDPEQTGKGNDQLGSGFYFTNKPETANSYTGSVSPSAPKGATKLGGDTSPGVIAAHLAIKKPLRVGPEGNHLGDAGVNMTHMQVKRIMNMAPNIKHRDKSPLADYVDTSRGISPAMIHDVAQHYTGPELHMLENDFFKNDPTAYREALHKVLGYDGVVKDFGNGEKHYVAWFPHQIKSAIGNRGTYDTNSDKITRKEGGSVKPVVRGIIKEQVTVIPDLAAMKRALMKAKR